MKLLLVNVRDFVYTEAKFLASLTIIYTLVNLRIRQRILGRTADWLWWLLEADTRKGFQIRYKIQCLLTDLDKMQ